jgi:hypothetical protein
MILKMAGARAKFSSRLTVFVETIFAEAGVGLSIVGGKIEVMLDEHRARVSVVSNAVSANPRIEKRKRNEEEPEKNSLRFIPGGLRSDFWG